MAQMDHPFLIPDSIQGPGGNSSQARCHVGPAERAEAVLSFRIDIGIAGIQGRSERVQYQESGKVRLMQHINMGKCSQTASIVQVAQLRVHLVLERSEEHTSELQSLRP